MGKWKNKLKDSSEGSKVSNHNYCGNNYKKNGGHGKFSKGGDQNKGGQRKFDKRNIQCYACQKWGHFADECYSNKGKQKKENEAQMAQGDYDYSDSDHVLLMVTTYQIVLIFGHWMNKGWFVNLDEKAKRMEKFADNSNVTTKEMGKVLIHRRDGQ
ncbi:hypothetical protein CR513_22735, partial [Mucuna pruriens]